MNPDLDMPADLPYRRATPLGWAFRLAFIVHAMTPGGVIVGLALGVVPAPWGYLLVLPGLALLVAGPAILVNAALRHRQRLEAMREVDAIGGWAKAVVLDVQSGTGSSRGDEGGQRRHFYSKTLRLTVHVPSGHAPYEISHTAYFTNLEAGRLGRGVVLDVKVHPADPGRVIVYPPPIPAPIAEAPAPGIQFS